MTLGELRCWVAAAATLVGEETAVCMEADALHDVVVPVAEARVVLGPADGVVQVVLYTARWTAGQACRWQ
jgi:hypothetical protein